MAATDFLHGVEVIEINDGTRPIRTVNSAIIGIIGTAPDANEVEFPLNKPVLIAGSRLKASKLDTTGQRKGRLPNALDQIGAVVVAVVLKRAIAMNRCRVFLAALTKMVNQYAGDFGSKRLFMTDPFVKVARDLNILNEPSSAAIAGMIAKTDYGKGFWWSPSNQGINGISGTARPIDFALGDRSSRANLRDSAVGWCVQHR
ncbi:MAG: Phage tail sheath protein FI [Candidatus Tokpelaia sp. JSC189]|nr:MAG: Phage tail sheath protein FI [Candidatus Tokpelaia sp. JSC189]